MPIYEYVCRVCRREFEALVRRDGEAACPECSSEDLDKKLSVVAVGHGEAAPAAGPCGACPSAGPGGCGLRS